MFPWTELRGHKLIDSLASGWNVNIISAINKCLTIVDDPSQVELDVIVMYPYKLGKDSANSTHSTISNYYRRREIRNYYAYLSDIAAFIRANPTINYRYFIQAEIDPESSEYLLAFYHEKIMMMIEQGGKDAKRTIDMGPGESFKQFYKGFDPQTLKRI